MALIEETSCFLCGNSANIECQECHGAWFCSTNCMVELHQPPQCFPIRVEHNPEVGRFLVASRDLAPLDVVLADTACPSGAD